MIDVTPGQRRRLRQLIALLAWDVARQRPPPDPLSSEPVDPLAAPEEDDCRPRRLSESARLWAEEVWSMQMELPKAARTPELCRALAAELAADLEARDGGRKDGPGAGGRLVALAERDHERDGHERNGVAGRDGAGPAAGH